MLELASTLLLFVPQGPLPTQHQRVLPELGITLVDERRLDLQARRVERRTTVDGRLVDGDAVIRAAHAARDARLGKLHPTLHAALAQPGPQQVAFWLMAPPGQPDLRATIDAARAAGRSAEAARRLALQAAQDAVAAGNAAFAAAATADGATVVHTDTLVPVVTVLATEAVVRALAARADVDLAYLSSTVSMTEGAEDAPLPEVLAVWNEWAGKTARTDAVHRRGINGAGVKVLVNDTAAVATTNPWLPPVVAGTTGNPAAHAPAVAGIIASRQTPHTGAAPGLTQIYSYGGAGDTVAQQAWAWGMAQGISFGNCSWWNGQKGQIRFLDRYFDYIIRNFAVMLFKSAGNQGGSDGGVTTPGCGYNMTASGNATDQNNADWTGDAMSSSSSWVNPLEGHDKPEVTACGTTITTTTTASPWIGAQGSGTSYASPVTCGIAALLAQTRPALQAQPEAVRALLMAGAFHNIEGNAVLSDRDGSGHVDAAASQLATARDQFHTATLTPASFTGSFYDLQVPLVGNDETRLCAVWFSTANSSYATDVLQMDLDLSVWLGSTLVASSTSAVNPFEIVQFVPPATGIYTVRLQNMRFLASSEPLAVAWVTRRDAATNEVVTSGTPAPGGTVGFEFLDRYHPGASYLSVLSVTPSPATMAVGPKKVLDLGYDVVTEFSLLLPGFGGTLDSNGRAIASLVLPNLPWLSGLPVHAAMVTLDPTLPELAEETSPTTTFVIQ